MRRLRSRLTYGNVMATAAMFLALGGTSYALTALPRNSVGAAQVRDNAIGARELRAGAVRSSEIKRRAIRLGDVSLSARRALRGQTGPAGPQGPAGPAATSLAAAVDAVGTVRSATASAVANHQGGSNVYGVGFSRDLTNCYAVASPSQFGSQVPDGGQASTQITTDGVIVRTRNSSGAPAELPFHLIVVC